MFVLSSSCAAGRGSTLVALTLAVLSLAGRAHAQVSGAATDAAPDAPAHIAVVEGHVFLDRESDGIPADAGEPIVPGDRVRTEAGRAEIWFSDGSTLALDARGAIELQSDSLIQLTAGRVYLMVSRLRSDGRGAADTYRIDTPLGSIAIDGPGAYSIALTADHVELAVVRGSAELLADGGTMMVRGGERTFARANGAPAYPQRFNAARGDEFERWVASVHDARRGGPTSTQYLPPNLQMYGGTFDRYGSWTYEPSYGYVWYPVVDAGWRPYYNGVWRPLPRYGWTWVGGDRWGWPTHHYGRWGVSRSRWFWIPERRWAPAWVAWASAADYVSWCPLGFDNRPVVGFSLSVGDTWASWVVLPRRSFGVRNAYVTRYAYDGRRLARNTPFVLHAQAPITPPAFRGRYDSPLDRRLDGLDGRIARRDGRRGSAASAGRAVERRDAGSGRVQPGDIGPRDANRQPSSAAAAPRDGWRTPLPPMAIPRGGDRPDGSGRGTRVDRGEPAAERDRADWNDRGTRAPLDNGPYVAGRRGSPRTYPATPSADDRPTPSAPRAGIRVDPGVPRAGDRLNPRGDDPAYRVEPYGRPPSGGYDPANNGARRRGADDQQSGIDRGMRPPDPVTPAPAGAISRGGWTDAGSRREPRAEAPAPVPSPERAGPRAEPRGERGADRGDRGAGRRSSDSGGGNAGGSAAGGDGGARRRGAR